MPTHSSLRWLHKEAACVEVFKFNRFNFEPGPGKLLTMSISFKIRKIKPIVSYKMFLLKICVLPIEPDRTAFTMIN